MDKYRTFRLVASHYFRIGKDESGFIFLNMLQVMNKLDLDGDE